MIPSPLYPMRFEPIFTNNLWGGRRLPGFLRMPATTDEPIGEAWVLSDVEGHASRIANGAMKGTTLHEALARNPERILGSAKLINGRFPLLLKFIDARQELSVQVHPDDEQAARKQPGSNGKTEAWVVLDANPATSRIYSGFRTGSTAADFERALEAKTTPQTLHSFTPNPGDCVFLEAGTVHAIGADILLFEVQQTCDITYRLYDWDRVDAKTGLPRQLHVQEGLEVANFASGPCSAVSPMVEEREGVKFEQLVDCRYFTLNRWTPDKRITIGSPGECRILIVLEADGPSEIEWGEDVEGLVAGDVVLIPAEVGEVSILPTGRLTLLECRLGS